jgi:hypothetical protein
MFRKAVLISLLIPLVAFYGSSIHAQSRRKSRLSKVQPRNTQPICTGSATITQIGSQDPQTLVCRGTLGCTGKGSVPCTFAVVTGLWELGSDGWYLVMGNCSNYVITCNTNQNFSVPQTTAGLPPGSYKWDVGVYTGTCDQTGVLWTTRSFSFTVIY